MGIQIKRFIGALAAVAAIGIGSAVPAHAASVTTGTRQGALATGCSAAVANASSGSPLLAGRARLKAHPDGVIRSKSVNIAVSGGRFTGTLEYYSTLVGKNYELYFNVQGKLTASGGTSYLYANYQCGTNTPQAPKIGQTTGTENIGYETPECSYGIVNMRVELCFKGSKGGGCTFSSYL